MRALIDCAVGVAVVASGLHLLWKGYVAVGSRVAEGKGLPAPSARGANSVGSQG